MLRLFIANLRTRHMLIGHCLACAGAFMGWLSPEWTMAALYYGQAVLVETGCVNLALDRARREHRLNKYGK